MISARLLSVVCVLLSAAAAAGRVNRRGVDVCYQPGVDCPGWGTKGGKDGSWFQTMQRAQARAQLQEDEELDAGQMNDYACDCCCREEECVYSAHLCVAEGTCVITRCYGRILGNYSSYIHLVLVTHQCASLPRKSGKLLYTGS